MERGSAVCKRSSLPLALLVVVMMLTLMLGLVGCSSEEEVEPQSVSDGIVSIEVPGSWTVEEGDAEDYDDSGLATGSTYSVYPEDGYALVLLYSIDEVLDGSYTAELWTYSIAYGFESSGDYTVDYDSLEETTASDDVVIDVLEFTYTDDDDNGWDGTLELLYSDDSISIVLGMCDADEVEEHGDEIDDVLDSVTIEDPSEPLLLDEDALEEELEELEEETEDTGETDESSDVATVTDGQIGDDEYAITLSGTWYVEESVDDTLGTSSFVAYSEDYTMGVSYMPSTPTVAYGYTSVDDFESDFFYGLGADQGECTETTTSDGVLVHVYDYSDDYGNTGYIELAYSGDTCAVILVFGVGGADDATLSTLTSILDSLTVANPSTPSIS